MITATRVAAPSPSLVSRLLAWLGWVPMVSIVGRRTGQPRHRSLAPVELNDERYLGAVRGGTDWAANLSQAGGGQMRRRNNLESFSAIEVTGPEREDVLALYERRIGRWMGITRIAGWPTASRVFRIRPLEHTAIGLATDGRTDGRMDGAATPFRPSGDPAGVEKDQAT
jgi:deazaflavin-dependent oxidoreductase (nitroreductase family)